MSLALALVLVAAVLIVLFTREEQTEFAGMEVTQGEIDELVQESMGKKLEDIPVRTLGDAVRDLPFRVDKGVKVFELEAAPLRWAYRDEQNVAGWGYGGQVPGPAIRVTEGDRVRIEFKNRLTQPTTVHWHGVNVPSDQDGVPGVSQDAIPPGKSFTYEFVASPAGTRFYHTHGSGHGDEAQQIDMGLAGAFIIEPKKREVAPDRDKTLLLDEWAVEPGGLNAAMMIGAGHAGHNADFNVFTINGRAAPDWTPLLVSKGELVRLRFVNVGSSTTHPMHLHGHQFTVTALDGNPVPPAARQLRNVIELAPGETADVEFVANNPGVWMLHCHELHHADAGMMTLVQYEGYEPHDAQPAHDHDDGDAH